MRTCLERRLCGGAMALAMLGLTGTVNAQKWTAPTEAELQMTSEPKAPSAPAVILSYDEVDDGDSAEVLLHVRIKVLTSGGLDAGTIELPDRIVSNDELERKIMARTIHSNGAIIEFKSTPKNTIIKGEQTNDPHKVITLPSVEVGSILEYTCHFAGQNNLYTYLIGWYAPVWRVQGPYFVKSAHFLLKTPTGMEAETGRWVANLPPGAQVVRAKHGLSLDVADIPPMPEEDFMPPASSIAYGVRFFYWEGPRDRFWGKTGANVDDAWFDFMATRKPIVAAAKELTTGADSDEQKLHRLYTAVQKLENTDMTREHTVREDRHSAVNSEDIWLRQRGDSRELTLLFVALARAAGYKAYPMAVSSRDHAVFDQNVLSWAQMNGMLAIVNVNGHEVYFDPGTQLCAFAHVAPWHSDVMGVSTEEKLVKIRQSPKEVFGTESTERVADLTVTATGVVSGKVRVAWVGNAGLPWRQQGLREDQHAVETAIERSYSEQVPAGVTLKLLSLEHLADSDAPLVAIFNISGSLGEATAKRLILPAQFFAGSQKPMLAPATRVSPVAFPSAYIVRDQVTVHLPSALAVETMPERKTLRIATDTAYDETAVAPAGKNAVVLKRTFSLSKIDYKPAEYGALHEYFANVATADGEQVVLAVGAKTAE